MKQPKICYVICYNSDVDDFDVYHIAEVCATRELAEQEVEKMKQHAREKDKQARKCDLCYESGYTIDGVRPDCFVDTFGECGNAVYGEDLSFDIRERFFYE